MEKILNKIRMGGYLLLFLAFVSFPFITLFAFLSFNTSIFFMFLFSGAALFISFLLIALSSYGLSRYPNADNNTTSMSDIIKFHSVAQIKRAKQICTFAVIASIPALIFTVLNDGNSVLIFISLLVLFFGIIGNSFITQYGYDYIRLGSLRPLATKGIQTTGTVTALNKSSHFIKTAHYGSNAYFNRIRLFFNYTTINGEIKNGSTSIVHSWFDEKINQNSVGLQLPIRYNENNTKKVVLDVNVQTLNKIVKQFNRKIQANQKRKNKDKTVSCNQ